MAIDTEDKRRSALHWVLPVPNSDVDEKDRAQVTWNYRGLIIAFSEPFYPGDTTFSRNGPGDTAFTRQGPGDTAFTRNGPGDVTFARKTS